MPTIVRGTRLDTTGRRARTGRPRAPLRTADGGMRPRPPTNGDARRFPTPLTAAAVTVARAVFFKSVRSGDTEIRVSCTIEGSSRVAAFERFMFKTNV